MRQRKILLAPAMLILSILACVSESQQGELPTDCVPVIASLYGEVDPTWVADVVAGETYELLINSHESSYHFYLHAGVYSIGDDGRVLIAESGRTDLTEEALSMSFTGPDSGRILIKLIELTGENGDYLGDISIKLCKDETTNKSE
jgi:hypothetical protein